MYRLFLSRNTEAQRTRVGGGLAGCFGLELGGGGAHGTWRHRRFPVWFLRAWNRHHTACLSAALEGCS
jgi:hypothetical protein